MSVMFSKVRLTSDNGCTATLLCSGCPKDNYDLEDWTIYQKFMSDNLHSQSVKAEVETYLYGDGEVFIANEYEVAAFTGRGEKFLHHPDVHLQNLSEFMIYPPLRSEVNSNVVPLSKSLLSMYLEYVPKVHANFNGDAPFFPGYQGKPITNDNLNANFRRLLYQAGISHGGRGKGPRIYDFRHTFAVNCLKSLVQRGADMNVYYPILKTYMGHSFFKYTEYYLKLTKNMYPNIGEKLSASLGSVIPEVWGDEYE